MNKQTVKKIVEYWVKTSEHDFDTMLVLFKAQRYSDSLFFGHSVLEKILKAHVVYCTKEQAPYIHDLVRLKELAKLHLTEDEVSLLNKTNDFNIRSRYPEYKLLFYKTCTKEYTKKYLDSVVDVYKKLCRMLK